MTGYTKLFSSILASTIWREDHATRIVWITLLAMADKDGVVDGSLPGLADFAHVSIAEAERALACLSNPDRYSRSKELEGRRIEVVEGGWRLVNHAKYRQKLNADERRDYLRQKQREYRKRIRESTIVDKVSDTDTVWTQAEAEAKADTEAKKDTDAEAEQFAEAFRPRPGAPLHSSHKSHAHCGRVCLPSSLFSEFVRRRGHPDADREIRDWALEVEGVWAEFAGEPGDAFPFWRARYAERWPTAPSAGPSGGLSKATAGTLAAASAIMRGEP